MPIYVNCTYWIKKFKVTKKRPCMNLCTPASMSTHSHAGMHARTQWYKYQITWIIYKWPSTFVCMVYWPRTSTSQRYISWLLRSSTLMVTSCAYTLLPDLHWSLCTSLMSCFLIEVHNLLSKVMDMLRRPYRIAP